MRWTGLWRIHALKENAVTIAVLVEGFSNKASIGTRGKVIVVPQ